MYRDAGVWGFVRCYGGAGDGMAGEAWNGRFWENGFRAEICRRRVNFSGGFLGRGAITGYIWGLNK